MSRYDYDPFGRITFVQGTNLANVQYAGYYTHQPSGLNLTLFRVYDPNTARWLSRDPSCESSGSNLHTYSDGNPVNLINPLGLKPTAHDQKRLNQYAKPSQVKQVINGGLQAYKFGSISGVQSYFDEATTPRYLYNQNLGWIDLKHVTAAEATSDTYIPSVGQMLGLGVEISQAYHGYIDRFADPLVAAGQRESAFEAEDLISNAIGNAYSISDWWKAPH